MLRAVLKGPSEALPSSGGQMENSKHDVGQFYKSAADNYSDQYHPSYKKYPANLKRLELLLARFQDIKAKSLLDCGCGEATPISRIYDTGIEVWGFDYAPEMVERAKANLESTGLSNRVWQGDITKASSFRPVGINLPEKFDVCLALGVLPHLTTEEDVHALRNMAAVIRQGGRIFVECRNELFGLFTLNRYSYALFCDKLIGVKQLQNKHPQYSSQLEEVSTELQKFFRLDVPPIRRGTASAPGYDAILSKFHNPFEVGDLFAKAALRIRHIHFYHYHAIPPLFEKKDPELFRKLSLEMEGNSLDWRGYFMASAFVVEAVKEEGQ